jgi:hypothetical protein
VLARFLGASAVVEKWAAQRLVNWNGIEVGEVRATLGRSDK